MQREHGKKIIAFFLAIVMIATLAACNEPEEPQPEGNPVLKVMLNITDYTFTSLDESIRLSAVVLPEDADDKTLTWTNKDPNVASINDEYTVVPLSNGETVITVTSVSGGLTAECRIKVELPEVEPPVLDTPVDGVIISPTELNFTEIGASEQMIVDVTPFIATNQNVIWTTSAPDVVSVDENGKVTALKEGKAVITVVTEDGGFTATCNVTVEIPKQTAPENDTSSESTDTNSGQSSSGNSGSSSGQSSSGNSGSSSGQSSSGNSGSSSGQSSSGSSGKTAKLPSIPAAKTDADHFLISDNLLDFHAYNPEVIGWLYVPGTNMNFPVAQGKDNEYYLEKGLDKKTKYTGSCFMDYRNEPYDSNLILYGHAKGTDIFDQLENVTQTKEWFADKNNMYVCYNTLTELQVWQVFACYYTNSDDYYYLWNNFYYDDATISQKTAELYLNDPAKMASIICDPKALNEFMTDNDKLVNFFASWRTRVETKKYGDVDNYLTSRDYGVKIEPGDKILTLSTCADASGPIRYLLLAKLIATKPRQ